MCLCGNYNWSNTIRYRIYEYIYSVKDNMKYTCADYRIEMILVSLRQRLRQEDLKEAERKEILAQIEKLEATMALD